MNLSNTLKLLFHNNSHKEPVITNKNLEILCIDFKGKTLTIKDYSDDKITEICMLNIGKHDLWLHCLNCETDDCEHITFAFYSHEIGTLHTLHTYHENIQAKLHLPLSIRQRRKYAKYVRDILVTRVIPVVAILIVGLGMAPLGYNPADGNWHSLITQLFDLQPLTPVIDM
jgi:hypothetical protein